MGIYACDYCHCRENTALGWYHSSFSSERMLGADYPDGTKLCSACTPSSFAGGSKMSKGGKWHGQFDRKLADLDWAKKQIEYPHVCGSQGLKDVLDGVEPRVTFNPDDFKAPPIKPLF